VPSRRFIARIGELNLATEPSIEAFTPIISMILVGYSGSGKSSVASMLARATDLLVLEMGDVVREEAAIVSPSVSAIQYANCIFSTKSPTYFALQLAKKIVDVRRPLIIVGPRRPEELEMLRASTEPSVCIALTADEVTRRGRQRERLDGDFDPELLKHWAYRDEVERAWGLDLTLRSADFSVDAVGPLRNVVAAVRDIWIDRSSI
jgi:cytidylate kinase